MKQDYIDFNEVKQSHEAVHNRLLNWGAWCKDGKGGNPVSPMFQNYKSKWRQWHEPEIRDIVDGIDAQKIQKLMVKLPFDHRRILAWQYTTNEKHLVGMRRFAKTEAALYQLLVDARQMVVNLG
ncbi:hypothetical protein UFOVP607_44 [uncultured Caudovirales phage]|uniref:Uncharacterized protein n=1 Tax=uncultured Caudovirales phage TaxID=2100421 RepID=A0A6J5N2U5_9CAUD|nr:hypothetical protein UFOVP607_44 [uncultured Caudovirales phage]